MSDDSTRPIVIKRKKVVADGDHGGAWKLAYADFVTALMAFFLLMWLLGSISRGDLRGIAEYFQNPLKIGRTGGEAVATSESILQGGGKDLTRPSGQTNRQPDADFLRQEQARLEALKAEIERMIEQSPQLAQFKKQLLLDITTEGLRIQIVDEQNRPMFDSGSDELKPYTRDILRLIGKALNSVSNRISLAGHTDAAPYAGGMAGFTNWELSANRANASRRELIVGGMADNKVLRVVGLASTVLFDINDPLNPVNRRISIVVLNRKTERAIVQEIGPEASISDAEAINDSLTPPGTGQGSPGG
ncbi:MAG: flagellar motor protein MotB [Azonexus sp.]|jgi:chemotaxis protein MotB|nr:flagellar motor protein MotB [Azonexus sp.]